MKCNCTLNLTAHEKLFGIATNTPENNVLKLNYCLLFAKYYLYYQKMHSMPCNFYEFILKLDRKLYIENILNEK